MGRANTPRETAVENAVVTCAEAHGWLVRKVKWIGRRAAPDRMFLKGGRVVWVEFKRPGEKPRPQQERELDRLRTKGAEVHVIDDAQAGYVLFG